MMTCRNDLMNLMTREYSGYPNWHWLIMSICNCSYNQLCTVQVVCSTNTHSSSADTSWQLHNGCQTVNFTNIYQDTLSEFTRKIISDLAVYFIVAFWLWADKILYNIAQWGSALVERGQIFEHSSNYFTIWKITKMFISQPNQNGFVFCKNT